MFANPVIAKAVQVRILYSADTVGLEKLVNQWLVGNPNYALYSMSYQVTENSQNSINRFSMAIFYRET